MISHDVAPIDDPDALYDVEPREYDAATDADVYLDEQSSSDADPPEDPWLDIF